MKILATILVLSSVLFAQETQEDMLKMLNQAYEKNSYSTLRNFLNIWAVEYDQNRKLTNDDRLAREVYSIFNCFYKPYAHAQVEIAKKDTSVPNTSYYYVIQSRVTVFITGNKAFSSSRSIKKMTESRKRYKKIVLWDFRPNFESKKVQLLSFSKKFKDVINSFLMSKIDSEGNIRTIPPPNDSQFVDKVRFLANYLLIKSSHWGNHLIIETQPSVDALFIDDKFLNALVEYTINYQFGTTQLKCSEGKWVIVKDKIIGTE